MPHFQWGNCASGKEYTFMRTIQKYDSKYHVSVPRIPNKNPEEVITRKIKKRWYRMMCKNNVPKRLWNYLLVWICESYNVTASGFICAYNRTPPFRKLQVGVPYISSYLYFSFCDWVSFQANVGLGEIYLVRFLRVSHNIGQIMS